MQQNQALNARIESTQSLQGPQVGSSLRNLSGFDLNGKPLLVTFSSASDKTLLLVFSPHCQYCKQNWPRWQKVLDSGKAMHVLYADLSGDADMAYLDAYDHSKSRQLIRLDQETKRAYSLSTTPTTLIIGKGGHIDGVWIGTLSEPQAEAIVSKL
ncbi:protein-disulfide isomerase [Granulicella aggregans]|uniref:Protein-disulfide isomerase n=1 Tax=Granulicella aggregans TaxID=474949 RepID=A0A7W8E758_9BACT|nr:hypothetical protein [Granulicella aggregans]MBB5061352.1 protein-disulfide isomerase [Granulicella aggregans]